MYKIIVCDLDETLLRKDKTISKRTINAIKKATELGVKFVPATGRGFNSVSGTLKDLGLYNLEHEYVISYNSGAITENKGNRLLHFDGIPFDVAAKLYKRGMDYDVCIHIYTKDTVYVYNYTEEEIDYLNGRMKVTEIFEDSIEFLKGQEIVKALYMNTNPSYLNWIEQDLNDITGELDVSYSSNRYIEFNHKGVNKGEGLKSLARLLHIPLQNTIAIGDNFNDLSMIKEAGLGIGVANCVDGIKADCDSITQATNDEDAIAEVIETYIL